MVQLISTLRHTTIILSIADGKSLSTRGVEDLRPPVFPSAVPRMLFDPRPRRRDCEPFNHYTTQDLYG